MSLGACCISGAIHEGTPVGSIKQIGGIATYVTLPSGDYDKTKAVLFCTDVFGLDLINNKASFLTSPPTAASEYRSSRLLADSFAANGFATYVPDLFDGKALEKDAMNDGTFDIMGWLAHHGQDVTRPYLDKVIAGLKAEGIVSLGATGYCFGGRYVVDLAIDNAIKVGVVAHPSLLKIPDDLETLKAKSKVPLLWNVAEQDYMYTYAAADQADKILGDTGLYTRINFDGCGHGFAVRGDMTKPEIKAGKEKAFEETVNFFKAKL
ncbi:hypothetical protein RQP46_008411 [Phenoliferia psychrophenolica]